MRSEDNNNIDHSDQRCIFVHHLPSHCLLSHEQGFLVEGNLSSIVSTVTVVTDQKEVSEAYCMHL
jgi:hypothetical protein